MIMHADNNLTLS